MRITQILRKCKNSLIHAIGKLKGSDKRISLAMIANDIGRGGQSIVSKEFKVSRDTIRKGKREIERGISIENKVETRGRKRIEEKLTHLLEDIKDIIDSQSQTDPNFKTTRLFTRLTSKEIRKQLIIQKKYKENELPTIQTINNKVNLLGYKLSKVRKLKPIKKIEETDRIFEKINQITAENKGKDNVVTISIDAKDKVKIGCFSRGGYSRTNTKALDHDFGNDYITPFGILDLSTDKVELTFTESKVTADFIADTIEQYWINTYASTTKDTLLIHLDNGPENSGRRTQFIKRITELSAKYNIKVILSYYPPYHSKYNKIERVWGSLEQHWNGSILDTKEAVLGFAKSMTWKGCNPVIKVTNIIYKTGIRLTKKTMEVYEQAIDRDSEIGKWFITITPEKCIKIPVIQLRV